MNDVYRDKREGVVILRVPIRSEDGRKTGVGDGSGFIYDGSTVITAGHVTPKTGTEVEIITRDGKVHEGNVFKTQNEPGKCDVAVIKTQEGVLSEYKRLEIGSSSSLRCGDPVIQIGSAADYSAAGNWQGLAAAYRGTRKYRSEFFSPSSRGGMSGGPVLDEGGKVVSLISEAFSLPSQEPTAPAPLFIHTRIPVYSNQLTSTGPNSETIRRFITEKDFYCP